VWVFYVLFRDYAVTDIHPGTFHWISFRYVLAVTVGIVSTGAFAEGLRDIGSFVLATLPFADVIRFIRSKAPGLGADEPGPKLSVIQGMDAESAERLAEVGIRSVQQLAFVDPLRLMLGSNLSPKVLIDWMDQAFLYMYVDKAIEKLRPRGVRGAMEMAALYQEKFYKDPPSASDPLIASFARCLELSESELLRLIKSLYFDNQVLTLWRLWGSLDPDQRSMPSTEGDEDDDDEGSAPDPVAGSVARETATTTARTGPPGAPASARADTPRATAPAEAGADASGAATAAETGSLKREPPPPRRAPAAHD